MEIDQLQWATYIPCFMVSLKCFEVHYFCVGVPEWRTNTHMLPFYKN
jgi:hypothetical protein